MAKKQYLNENFPHLLHGADYNPEQWKDQPQILQEDMRLMKLAGLNEMTLGVFSWAELEKEEGVYDFSFLDSAFDRIEANGGKIILATPSGARPRWLAEKYPEVLRTRADRMKNLYGFRHNHCLTSPVYREKTRAVNYELAKRYGHRKSLYAWHISNEVSGECHCPLCRAAFVEWCRNKYGGDIQKLNHEWWTAFWSHQYSSFSQIEPPSWMGDESVMHGLVLDWKRFCTDQTADFLRNEQIPLRQLTPHIPTTTNLMGLFDGLDYKQLAKSVDFVSWDSYPEWGHPDGDKQVAISTSFMHDEIRGLKDRNFLLMECTPSLVNWREINKLKRPGQHLAASMQAIAHGAESVQYFQFRKSRGAAEKMHGAVVDHAGHEHTRVFSDVQQVGQALRRIDEVCGTACPAEVALVFDRENLWALQVMQGMQLNDKKYTQTLLQYYTPLWERGINADVISRTDDFSRYKLVIAPMLYMAEESVIDRLEQYVRQGGVLVGTYATAQVNENDLCHLGGFPGGKLKEVFGVWAEELDTLHPDEENTVTADGRTYAAVDYCELIHADGAQVIARYASDFYAGMPACTVHTYGKGKAYYMAFRDRNADYIRTLLDSALSDAQISPALPLPLPDGVTVHTRSCDDARYLFVECHNARGADLELPKTYFNLTENVPCCSLHFDTYGAAVLRET